MGAEGSQPIRDESVFYKMDCDWVMRLSELVETAKDEDGNRSDS